MRLDIDELCHQYQPQERRILMKETLHATIMKWLPDNWKPKVVAVDIDGTLTNENKLIEPSVIDALQELEKNGIPVILATGNV